MWVWGGDRMIHPSILPSVQMVPLTVGDFGEKSEKIQNIDKFCIYMAKNDIFVIKIHSSFEKSKIDANC